jgi:hypothetical protein
MLAKEGLHLLGVPRDGFHLTVGRFDEFSSVPRPFERLPGSMQLFDVVVGLPQSFVRSSLGGFHILGRFRAVLTGRVRERRRGPPAAQQLHDEVLIALGTCSSIMRTRTDLLAKL